MRLAGPGRRSVSLPCYPTRAAHAPPAMTSAAADPNTRMRKRGTTAQRYRQIQQSLGRLSLPLRGTSWTATTIRPCNGLYSAKAAGAVFTPNWVRGSADEPDCAVTQLNRERLQ